MTAIALAPLSPELGDSRPARKENKVRRRVGDSSNNITTRSHTLYHQFVAFFRSRSRSRSRSRAKSSPNSSAAQSTTELQTLPPLPPPKPRISHARSTSLANEGGHTGHARTASTTVHPISKPATRITSRPISSTTTATHSTITPLPSDSIRRRQRLARNAYSHDYQVEDSNHQANEDPATSHDDHDSAPRSDTPSSFNQRRRLELLSIFGIGLSRKSSMSNSSRKPSPGASSRKVSSSTLSQKEVESKPSRKRSFRFNSRPSTPKSVDEPRLMKTSTSTLPTPSSPLPLSASPRRLSFGLTSSSRVHTPMTSSGHLPLAHSSRHGKRQSMGSHETAHDSAVALPDDHSDGVVSSSHLDARSGSHTDPSKLTHSRSRKGKEHERDNPKWSPVRKTSRTDGSRLGGFRSLPEETSPIVNISPPPQNESHGKYDPGGLVSVLSTVESRSSGEDVAGQLPVIRAPLARPAIPQIIHTPPTPQRTVELDPPMHPATVPPRLSGGKGKPREVVLSQEAVTVHNELPKLHAQLTAREDSGHSSRIRNRFSPRLFGGKDLSREKESKKQKPGNGHDHAHSAGAVGSPRSITSRRIQHGSFDFERPVSTLNRSNSTVNAPVVKGEGSTQSRKNGVATHRPTILEQTTSLSSGKSRTYAYHPARADSPILTQLSPHHTGETSAISLSSQSAQSKSTGKNSVPVPGQQSSSWGRSSGRQAQRTSHGPFPFEPAVSAPNSPLPTSSALPRCSLKSSSHRVEFEVPQGPASVPTRSPLRGEFGLGGGSIRDKSQSAHGRGQHEREKRIKEKGKGRSLDLNLGLSWAPNRVRQEAVIPGLLLSQVIPRRQEEERRGKDVTKVFENVLSESGFETFKKC
jgi:hypothetical protein